MSSDAKYLTVEAAAAHLSLTPKALRNRMVRGTVPAWTYTHMGRSIRFIRASLDEWLTDKAARLRDIRRAS